MINISAAKWSHNVGLGNAALGDIDQKAYTYDYDPMYRLKTADHYEKTQSWSDVLSNNVSNLDYDLNGNIESISRKTSFGLDMDVLTYDYGTGTNRSNQLLSIDDDSENVLGFKDGHDHITTGVDDYSYDGNGSLKADNNKGITRISYNHLNLPDTVEFTGNKMIRFIYNSVGLKLAQENYENSSLKMRKDFAGEFYYENDTLRFISHQEGKAVPEIDGNYTYLYDIKDHLGNNRLSFTSKPKNWEFDASMEGENSSDEEMLFSNVQETRVTFNGANHTPGGNEVAQLNSTQPVGPAISLAVNPGDTITLETYAYYEGGSGYSSTTSLASFVAAVAGSFGGLNGGTIEQQATFDAFDNAYGGLGFGGTQEDNVPAAYLNYIFFDQNMNYRSSGFSQISIAANISHERVALEDLVMKEAGFIYAFVSMESAGGNVYFDDFKLYLRESRVVSASGYMPFGLTFDNYQRPTEPTQFFLFNGKERISDFDLNWDNFGARMYMADIGRWGVVDPMADKGPNLTPYRYAFNNPINVIDPDGRYEVNIGYGQSVDHKEFSGARQNNFSFAYNAGDKGGDSGSSNNEPAAGNANMNNVVTIETEQEMQGQDRESDNNQDETEPWDLNGDGIFQKNEADNWWLTGSGNGVTVDNHNIDWTGLVIPEGLEDGDIFAINTTDAFEELPYETASTYGGTSFRVVSIKSSIVQVLDQRYHYNYRPNNSSENRARNFMTWVGRPSGEGENFMIHYTNPYIWIK